MSDFVPPSGPPPPRVPEGWRAVWNQQYQEWFFVNLHTKESTWDKPTEPAFGGAGGPPGYSSGPNDPVASDTKRLSSNNPYGGDPAHETDEQMAARLQAEERAHGGRHGDRGQSDSYYGAGGAQQSGGYPSKPQGYDSQQLPARPEEGKQRGLFSKLMGKSSSSRPQQSYGQQQGYGGGYGGPPMQQGYGGYPQQSMYGGGGYGGGGYGQPPRRQGGGLGTGGALALGAGGGLLGGMMLGEAMDGGDGGGDGGGDYGGGGGDGGGGDGGGGGDF